MSTPKPAATTLINIRSIRGSGFTTMHFISTTVDFDLDHQPPPIDTHTSHHSLRRHQERLGTSTTADLDLDLDHQPPPVNTHTSHH
ncbi:hypothetical protein FRC04_006273 [Tulasnella sp. 424]|nr:hypothetical protein FRC04_006273 [Tulasnella sp. 424]KAG8961007.1 hypothetical protein FRC05_006406 [Tulasnella sp. 425]